MAKTRENYKLEAFKLHKNGKSVKEIAELTNCSIATIYSFLKRYDRIPNTIQSDISKIEVVRVSKYRPRKFRCKKSISNRELLDEYLKTHHCVDCGNSDVRVLEFDHVRGEKIGNVTGMARNGCTMEKLTKEIDKCEVRCANCHRIVTIIRRNIKNQNN